MRSAFGGKRKKVACHINMAAKKLAKPTRRVAVVHDGAFGAMRARGIGGGEQRESGERVRAREGGRRGAGNDAGDGERAGDVFAARKRRRVVR